MITNKPNFIPSGYALQPEFYRDYFSRVTAVFRHPNGANILVEVDANIWTNNNPFERRGDLVVEYQGSKSRHILSIRPLKTIKEAIQAVETLIKNPRYGESFKDKPVSVEEVQGGGPCWPNDVLVKRQIAEHRKKCRYIKPHEPFSLTEEDKAALGGMGYSQEDFAQIEQCANQSVYLIDDKESIPLEDVLEMLGRQTFLSGIARSAFHWTCLRESPDGNHSVFFESGKMSPFRKKA